MIETSVAGMDHLVCCISHVILGGRMGSGYGNLWRRGALRLCYRSGFNLTVAECLGRI
jgi:hypothetical protein